MVSLSCGDVNRRRIPWLICAMLVALFGNFVSHKPPGSARVSRAGEDVSSSRTLKRLFRRDAESPSRTSGTRGTRALPSRIRT